MKAKLAIVQMQMADDEKSNELKALKFFKEATFQGANIIMLPELFLGHYFPQNQLAEHFDKAKVVEDWEFLKVCQDFAREHQVVLPISFFEKSDQSYFNSLAMVDADGSMMGVYRKTHIPDGPGYQEKFYFRPGNTGFKVWETKYGKIGVGICWDQWFPESARIMALKGADLLLYPTAIGSEPEEADLLDTSKMWKRAMIGHSVSNSIYLAAANRIGKEGEADFYGNSFIADPMGETIAAAGTESEDILYANLDFQESTKFRASMGFFRDRRPELYKELLEI